MLARAVLVVATVHAGCIDAGLSRCSSGRICGEGLVCDNALDQCVSAVPVKCGDGAVAVEEECDDGNHLSHDGCSSQCRIESPTWTQVGSALTGAGRYEHAVAYDALRGRVVMFGGADNRTFAALADTREWDGSQWVRPSSITGEPAARSDTAMAFDPVGHRILMYGGINGALLYPDTWAWDGTTWTQLSPANVPAARAYDAMTTDTARGRVVVFGGIAGVTPVMLTNEVLEWDGSNWTTITPVGGLAPSPRDGPAISYDARRARAVTFGGTDSGEPYLVDTWEWDGMQWHEPSASGPIPRIHHAMAYDGSHVVMFGGGNSTMETGDGTLVWDGSTWTANAVPGPAGREGVAMAYDALDRAIVLVGGMSFDDTWTFRYERAGDVDESCRPGEDLDADGLAGCDDPDCWARCTPLCPPGTTCDPAAPHCGDGVCNAALEQGFCPSDCT